MSLLGSPYNPAGHIEGGERNRVLRIGRKCVRPSLIGSMACFSAVPSLVITSVAVFHKVLTRELLHLLTRTILIYEGPICRRTNSSARVGKLDPLGLFHTPPDVALRLRVVSAAIALHG